MVLSQEGKRPKRVTVKMGRKRDPDEEAAGALESGGAESAGEKQK